MWDAFHVCTFSTKCVLINGWSPIRSAPYAEWTSRPSCQVKVDTVFQNSYCPSHSHSSWYCSQPKMAWLTCADLEALNSECWLCYMVQLPLDLQLMYTVDFDVFIKAFVVFFSRFDISSCIILLYFCMIPCIAFLCTYYGLVTLNLQARLAALVSSIFVVFLFWFFFFYIVPWELWIFLSITNL